MSSDRIAIMLRCESLILETYSASCQSTLGQNLCLECILDNNLTKRQQTQSLLAYKKDRVDDFLHRYSSTFDYPLVIDERKIKLRGNVAVLN